MPSKSIPRCGFCGRPRNEVKTLISGSDEGPYICNRCVEQSAKAIIENAAKEAASKEEPLKKPREIKAILDQHVIAQEKCKTDVAIAVYNHYKRREAAKSGCIPEGVEVQKSNILLLGPSGTGKTEVARTVARMLNVPFHVGDATRLTQAGYVGDDVESLLQGLIQAADGDIERAQWGIIFLDEIDKLARKSGRGATGYRDVTGEGVQQALLKILEGSQVLVPRGMGKMMIAGGPAGDAIDTSNILFIGAGSFAGIEEIVEKRVNKHAGIGFGAQDKHHKLSLSDIYTQVNEEDVLEFGLIPEMMGRLPIITSTLELTEDEMVRILTEPKNALAKQFVALYAMDGVDLQFDEAALKAIGREAKKRPTGARALRSILESVLRPYSFDTPSDPTVAAIRVTEDVVDGKGQAVIVRKETIKEVGTA
jgi:ATP-dependent Clp protease ATP-binding subunit ClpX